MHACILCEPLRSIQIRLRKLCALFPRPINHPHAIKDRPVFITGAPRCGSSWVGEILGNCKNTRYVYEPFNHRWVPTLREQLPHFTYVNASSRIPLVVQQSAKSAFMGLQTPKQLARAAYRHYWKAATRPIGRLVGWRLGRPGRAGTRLQPRRVEGGHVG